MSLRRARKGESEEERAVRIEYNRRIRALDRARETEQQRKARLECNRISQRKRRKWESLGEKQRRLESVRAAQANRRTRESTEERDNRLENDRKAHADRRCRESGQESNVAVKKDKGASSNSNETIPEPEVRVEIDTTPFLVCVKQEFDEEITFERVVPPPQPDPPTPIATAPKQSTRLAAKRQAQPKQSVPEVPLKQPRPDQRTLKVIKPSSNIPLTHGMARQGVLGIAHFLGEMDQVCPHCGALHFLAENSKQRAFNSCCNNGTIKLPLFDKFPDNLRELLTGENAQSKEFRADIRNLNNRLAMASMSVNSETRGYVPYCFKAHGTVYHQYSLTKPATHQAPTRAQALFLDNEQVSAESAGRLSSSSSSPAIFSLLHSILVQRNPFIGSLKMMDEVCITEKPQVQEIRLKFVNQSVISSVSKEVVGLYVANDDDAPPQRIATVFERTGGYQQIRDIDLKADPLAYPILFPNGEFGWDPHLKRENSGRVRDRISQREYYAYYLFPRSNHFSPILAASKLFQQYIVDSWLKTEQNRSNYQSTFYQSDLRSNIILGLEDDLEVEPGQTSGLVGCGTQRTVAAYQDAMTITSRFGRPDICLTFPCNPLAREIVENLEPYQTASDRPDLVARVFKLKLDSLIEDLHKNQVFGQVVAHISVVEFQKSGLPRCHMLLYLAEADKFVSSTSIDEIISAELPGLNSDPELFNIVSKFMIHRPCGTVNPSAPCMVDGKCSKSFPKEFCQQTNFESEAGPVYRRRRDGRVAMVGEVYVDNRWIVPYSPYLSRRYNAHINVEICSNVSAVKFLSKYVYKGADRVRVALNSSDANSCELTTYMDVRYVCPTEAIYRFLSFPIQDKSHSVVRLHVHLPELNSVIPNRQDVRAAFESSRKRDTTLTGWFKLNAKDPQAREFHYWEITEHYVKTAENLWKLRDRTSGTLGRLMFVSPLDQERFAVRLLLLNVKGATSFECLRTVDGVVHPTFSAAAKAAGWMIDRSHAKLALQEALLICSSARIRALFVVLLNFCEIPDSTALWEEFKGSMSEDFASKHSQLPDFKVEKAEALAFAHISSSLESEVSETLKVSYDASLLPASDQLEEDVRYEKHARLGKEMYITLSDQQRTVADSVLSTDSTASKCFFIEGSAGSGKTLVLNALYHLFISRRLKVQCLAWTEIAANLLPKGHTVGSVFQLVVPENDRSTMNRSSKQSRRIVSTDVFICDDAQMVTSKALEVIDLLLKELMQNDLPFGGKFMVLAGDFRQILSIVEHGDRSQQVAQCLKTSPLWTRFVQLQLGQNMRLPLSSQSDWENYILAVGEARIQVSENGTIPILNTLRCRTDLIDQVYKYIGMDDRDLSEIAILTSTTQNAQLLNERILSKLPGEMHTSRSIDEVVQETRSDALNFPTELVNQMTPTGMPPHVLNLKRGAVISLLRNLNVREGLCDGTRLVVQHVGRRLLSCTIAAGPRKGEETFIPQIDCYYDRGLPFKLRRRQFPVVLSFAMTINKAQGQTFDRVGLCLNDRIFSHGQLYLALSRARSRDGVFVECSQDNVTNVVFKEVL